MRSSGSLFRSESASSVIDLASAPLSITGEQRMRPARQDGGCWNALSMTLRHYDVTGISPKRVDATLLERPLNDLEALRPCRTGLSDALP